MANKNLSTEKIIPPLEILLDFFNHIGSITNFWRVNQGNILTADELLLFNDILQIRSPVSKQLTKNIDFTYWSSIINDLPNINTYNASSTHSSRPIA